MKFEWHVWVSLRPVCCLCEPLLDSPVTLRLKQNEINRYRADTPCQPSVGTITVMFNIYLKGATP
jgi:hypothetical protein